MVKMLNISIAMPKLLQWLFSRYAVKKTTDKSQREKNATGKNGNIKNSNGIKGKLQICNDENVNNGNIV